MRTMQFSGIMQTRAGLQFLDGLLWHDLPAAVQRRGLSGGLRISLKKDSDQSLHDRSGYSSVPPTIISGRGRTVAETFGFAFLSLYGSLVGISLWWFNEVGSRLAQITIRHHHGATKSVTLNWVYKETLETMVGSISLI
ncbi:hypothetical protein NPIL_554151 [Nephila pilipes]|uniref:Uncharacterized protein n=1 Tax=Nephila pilipes TaxID=299642 RepID=A0A8X6PJM5_NEPPI|nr:hypothetical protein NPIL_554151 [Nephila pilipes]